MIVAPRPLAAASFFRAPILDTDSVHSFAMMETAAAAAADVEMGTDSLQGMETLAHLHAHLHGLGLSGTGAADENSNSPEQSAPLAQSVNVNIGGGEPRRKDVQASLRRKRQLPYPSQPRTSLDSDSPRSGSGSDSDAPRSRSNTPDSNSASGSGSEQGNSCPNTPSMNAGLALAVAPGGVGASKHGRPAGRPAIAAGDDVLENELQVRWIVYICGLFLVPFVNPSSTNADLAFVCTTH